MTLFEHASKNKSLQYIDSDSGLSYKLSELPGPALSEDGKRLAFLYPDNSIKGIGALWSVMKSSHCAALLSPDLPLPMKIELEQLYRPDYIFDQTRSTIDRYSPVLQGDHSFYQSTEVAGTRINDAIKVLLSTSGTTGSPKFVKLSEQNIVSNALSISSYLPIREYDVTPLNLPVYYSYGLSVLTSNSVVGGKIVCGNNDVLKKEFWEKFAKAGYTSIAGVPYVYEMLDRIGFTKKSYPSLRYFTQAGGKLRDSLVTKFADYAFSAGAEFYVMYGQTEATARMSYLPPDRLKDKFGSIGKAIPGGSFSVDSHSGELCYSGPNVAGGYVKNPSDLETFVQPPMLRTGDIARVDDEGFYYITGRINRFVKLFGNRVNLDEVEDILFKRMNLHARCAGHNDEKLLVFIGESADPKGVSAFISSELKIHPTAIRVIPVPEIPLTANGKVDYTKLVATYGAQ